MCFVLYTRPQQAAEGWMCEKRLRSAHLAVGGPGSHTGFSQLDFCPLLRVSGDNTFHMCHEAVSVPLQPISLKSKENISLIHELF